ncbi:MAG: hypothetical protein KAT68_02915 [Bacteroidales bacterium]|nr:hypothetical protein [Bacteroidales bacterium]
MLKAGALYYAIFISFILTLLAGFFILLSHLTNLNTSNIIERNKLIDNINSSINILLSKPDLLLENDKIQIDLFEDEKSFVDIEKKNWGVYYILKATAKRKNFTESKIVLLGEDINRGEKVALYLADLNNSLSLCGKTKLIGNCYLPKLMVKRAYIEGKNYIGKKLVYGETKNSKETLPLLNKEIVEINNKYLNGKYENSDSIKYYEEFSKTDTINNSFYKKTIYIQLDDSLELKNKIISGNIILYAKKVIIISNSAELKNIRIYAPKVVVKSGFKGNCQIFAKDTIIIEKKCHFEFPSFLAIYSSSDKVKTLFKISKECTIAGGVFHLSKDVSKKSTLFINKDVKIYGQVYSNSQVEHKGKIFGTLYCNKFILKTTSSVYENHLLDAIIDIHTLSSNYIGTDLLNISGKKEIIKCLN